MLTRDNASQLLSSERDPKAVQTQICALCVVWVWLRLLLVTTRSMRMRGTIVLQRSSGVLSWYCNAL